MKRFVTLILVVGLSFFLIGTPQGFAAEKDGIKIGSLQIKSVPGTRSGLLINSSVDVTAVFTDSKGNKEYYVGETGIKLGLNLSAKDEMTISYLVFSASSDYKTGSHALEGKYFGQRVSAALGAGVGVAVLIGGFDKSFTLQPLSIETLKGWGAEAGLGYLYLQKDMKDMKK